MKVKVNVRRVLRTGDGEGHKVQTGPPSVIALVVPADLEYHTTAKLSLLEQGPGLSVREYRLLIITRKPWPDVQHGDILEVVGDKAYNVMFVRKYQNEMQIDMQEQG